MIRASNTTPAQTPLTELIGSLGLLIARFSGLPGAIRASTKKIECAHAGRAKLASIPVEVFEDTGFDPSEASGVASWQPDLPFFMQSGFGKK